MGLHCFKKRAFNKFSWEQNRRVMNFSIVKEYERHEKKSNFELAKNHEYTYL